MKKTLLMIAAASSLSALAAGTGLGAVPPGSPENGQGLEWGRTQRLLRISEALNLSERDALKLSQTMRQFDTQREPLREQVRQANQILRSAAKGDASVFGQVDQAAASLADARTRLMQVNQQMVAAISLGLTPQQKAKLMLVFEHHGKRGPAGRRGR